MKFILVSSFYPPYHLGGDAVHVQYLAEALVKRGHEVHVIHNIDAYYMKRKMEPTNTNSNSNIHLNSYKYKNRTFGFLSTYMFGNNKSMLTKYKDLINQIQPDVVHHHNISLMGHLFLKKIGPYTQLYTAHDHWLICPKNDYYIDGAECNKNNCKICLIKNMRPPQFWRKKLSMRDIDVIITPSRYIRNRIEKQISGRYVTIPNFVPKPPEIIKSSGYEDYYLFIGVLSESKGLKSLLAGFKANDKKLLIAGKGPLEAYVRKFIEQHRLENRITHLGWVNEIYPYLKDANALIIPSITPENSPLVALEALSVGTPVCGTDLGGLPEIIGRLSGKFIIPTSDLTNFLATIKKPDIPSETIRQVYRENYSEENYLKNYLKIIGDIKCTS